jgi:hypothetical protein
VRFTIKQVLSATFGLAALLIIVEHAGGFSQILESGAGAYATGFQALTGHARATRGGGVGYTRGIATGRAGRIV